MPNKTAKGAKRKDFLPFFRPSITEEEIKAVENCIRSGWITTGPHCAELEKKFAKYVQAEHAIAVNSGTAALHLGLLTAGIKPGDEVLVPTMTFTATAEVVLYCGAKPMLVDCNPKTLNICLEDMKKKRTSSTKAIMPVHVAGFPCDLKEIQKFANKHNLKVIEDAAHAFPTRYEGQLIGGISDATAFSFYATKTMTTGEGGMLTTNNAAWAEQARLLRQHGLDRDSYKRDDTQRSNSKNNWQYSVVAQGYKYNMSDINASMGLVQLKRTVFLHKRRKDIAKQYATAFEGIEQIRLPQAPKNWGDHSWHLFYIFLELEKLKISRAEFIAQLKAYNIGASVHFIPLHLHEYYRQEFGYTPEDYPIASDVSSTHLSLPIYPDMSEQDVEDVIDAVQSVCQKFAR